jgi:hypothetical protein
VLVGSGKASTGVTDATLSRVILLFFAKYEALGK